MGYDLENHLISVSGSASMSLAYDPKGRLHRTDPSSSTVFLHDGDSLVEELDASGTPNILRRYVPGNSVDDTLVWYEGGGLGTPNMLYTDEQGSVIATANSSSTSQYVYSPTGEPTNWSGARFRYTGQAALPEVQLYYYKARMYDPHLGRFLQTDPIGYVSDYNLYAYVGNDPVNRANPTGLASGLGSGCSESRANPCSADVRGPALKSSASNPEQPANEQAVKNAMRPRTAIGAAAAAVAQAEALAKRPPYNMTEQELHALRSRANRMVFTEEAVKALVGRLIARIPTPNFKMFSPVFDISNAADTMELPDESANTYSGLIQNEMDAIDDRNAFQQDLRSGNYVPVGSGVYVFDYRN